MDLEFQHPTDIYSLRPCRNSDAHDLIAIGGEHSVDVLQVVGGSWTRIFKVVSLTASRRLNRHASVLRPFMLVRV